MSNELAIPIFSEALSLASILGTDVHLQVTENTAELYSSNLFAAIRSRFDRDSISSLSQNDEFNVTIRQAKISALRSMIENNDDANVFVSDNEIIIKTGLSSRKISLSPCPHEIPLLKHEDLSFNVISPALFLESIQKSVKFSDQRDDMPTGYIHVEDGIVYGLSYHSSIICHCPFPYSVKISRDQVKILSTLLKYERLEVSDDTGSWTASVSKANGKPIAFCKFQKPVMPDYHIKSSVIKLGVLKPDFSIIDNNKTLRTNFSELLKRVSESSSVHGPKEEQAVRIRTSANFLNILSSSSHNGVDTYKSQMGYTGAEFDKTLSPILISKALQNVDTHTIAWGDNENAPIHFVGKKCLALISRTLIKVEETAKP